ncbi:MAG TPA: aminotransferase class III-fold pyridoxal phosphate-dependent enzyme [candidate division Zixibacteria bacterium]|nr:aminotransferase class III-fold pyridoxal phosphate-dependent enzyme [candidate division Zixibacteria bacterium]
MPTDTKDMMPAEERYRSKTRRSHDAFKQMASVMPGVAKGAYYYAPYPITIDHADGCYLYDIDGNQYVDFANHHTAQILGHNHPAINEAVTQQLKKGIAVAGPMGVETQLASEICRRVDSVESIRFCNSGTEATLHAVRLAREYTGRYKIAKFEGGYHGSHDAVEISVAPDLQKAGPSDRPNAVPTAGGMPPNATENIVILPDNNEEAVERIIAEHKQDLACVLLDPKAGIMPQRPEFVRTVREITEKNDILLMLDEIVGFRAARGGIQSQYNISPDLTTFGKIIGGGFPIGAFGGRKDLMALLDPTNTGARLFQSGTFSAHPVAMAAGMALLGELNESAFEHLAFLTSILEWQKRTSPPLLMIESEFFLLVSKFFDILFFLL